MKRVLMLLFVITLILVGCAEGKPVNDNSNESKREDVSEISKTDNVSYVNESNDEEQQLICSDYRFSENGEVYNFLDTLNILCEEGENYKIYSNRDATSHYYVVYDNDEYSIDHGYFNFKRPVFERHGDILVLEQSHGMSIVTKKFYDIENARVSRWYEMVFAYSGELIAYYSGPHDNLEHGAIVIANMFDRTEYYHEFPRDVSVSSLMMAYSLGAEFIENDTKFKITYTNINDEEVTEIIELP